MLRLFALLSLAAALHSQDMGLGQIRQINLDRAANLPNFIADEIVTGYAAGRYRGPAASAPWEHGHTFQAEIAVKGTQIGRRNVLRDGSPWENTVKGSDDVTANMPATGFGASLKALFDPACPTTLSFDRKEDTRGEQALIYRFRSPANGCFGNLYGGRGYNAARSGHVFIDASTGDVLQWEEEATGFPKGFAFTQRNQTMTWNRVVIGGAAYWLPVFADFVWKQADGSLHRSTVEYKNHRHFEALSGLNFE